MDSTVAGTLQITLNGEARTVKPGASLDDLLRELALDSRKVAIEHNRVIVARSLYGQTPVVSGDAIEIVGFIGGG